MIMGFLIRSAFWLSLVLLLLPIGTGSDDGDFETVGPVTAFFAAKEAFSDVTGICERKPDVCETGRSIGATIAVKARESARIVLAWVEEEPAGERTAPTPTALVEGPATDGAIVTGTIVRPEAAVAR
jgi:hypothetical protein